MSRRIDAISILIPICLVAFIVWAAVAITAANETAIAAREEARAADAQADVLFEQVRDLGAKPAVTPEPGSSGPEGPPGPEGPQGPMGRTGLPGAPGEPGHDGVDGKAGADGKDGTNGTDGKDSTVPGPSGPAGQPGRDGLDGEDGADGATGERGSQGEPGPPGYPASFTQPGLLPGSTVTCRDPDGDHHYECS